MNARTLIAGRGWLGAVLLLLHISCAGSPSVASVPRAVEKPAAPSAMPSPSVASATVASSAVSGASSGASAEPPAPAPIPDLTGVYAWTTQSMVSADPRKVPTPSCFAYDPHSGSYACIGYRASNERWYAKAFDEGPQGKVTFDGVGFIDLVADDWDRFAVYSSSKPAPEPLTPRSEVDRALWEQGYRPATMTVTPLPAGAFQTVGKMQVRYTPKAYEWSISYGVHAVLTVRCPSGKEASFKVHDRGTAGMKAVLFTAPGATTHALSTIGENGGEGTEYHTLTTMLLDLGAMCPG